MGQSEVVDLLMFVFPINHWNAYIHHWDKSSNFLSFKLPTSQGFVMQGYSGFSLQQ